LLFFSLAATKNIEFGVMNNYANLLQGVKNMTEAKVCCICNEKFIGWGNNPYPVKEDGECCKPCDDNVVVPARIKEYEKEKNELN
jgi:hypothetical protein